MTKLSATASIQINAPKDEVWQALTDPKAVKAYLFGTDVHTDWKKDSPITYTGVWQGKSYEDKGVIIDIKPGEFYHSTYLSSMSGKEDKPENYNNVIWKLTEDGNGGTIASVSQDNINTEEEKLHSQNNWSMVLNGIKNWVEENH